MRLYAISINRSEGVPLQVLSIGEQIFCFVSVCGASYILTFQLHADD